MHAPASPAGTTAGPPTVVWEEGGRAMRALWRSATGAPPPRRVRVVDDRLRADDAYRLASEGTALLWRGDYHNARTLLAAMRRRAERRPAARLAARMAQASPAQRFHLHRQARAQRTRTLSMLLVPFAPATCWTFRAHPTCGRRAPKPTVPRPASRSSRRCARCWG